MNGAHKKYTVFIIDDDQCSLDLIESMLKCDSYEIISFKSSPDAFMQINKQKPDLVLLNINMPKMNGFEICQAIKANPSTSAILVMLMTAFNSSFAQFASLITYRADCFMVKPFSRETLVKKIETLFSLKEGHLPLGHNSLIANFI